MEEGHFGNGGRYCLKQGPEPALSQLDQLGPMPKRPLHQGKNKKNNIFAKPLYSHSGFVVYLLFKGNLHTS